MGLQTVRQLSAVVLSAVVGCAISTANAAENYYKWVDQYGTTQYTQTPPPASARKTYKRVSVSTHVPADVRNRAAAPVVAPQPTAPNASATGNSGDKTNTPPASPAATPSQTANPTASTSTAEPVVIQPDATPPAKY